jgi:D-glycero-D-manno-heptose 1,7-bisphosphate phosphatase
LSQLKAAGFTLVVVSNQAVVARGLVTESEVEAIHRHLAGLLQSAGAPPLDGWYFCPHHPNASLPAYRVDCDCRKPKPGLLQRAARELNLDMAVSFMVGDRPTDILAGHRAGCRTVLVETGKHNERPIETTERLPPVTPEHRCPGLIEAAAWILRTR